MFGRRDVQEKLVDAALARRAWALGRRQARRARVDERRAISVLIDLLEVYHKLRRVVFGVREHLGAEEGDDVVRDDLDGLGLEIGIVDAKMAVEPVDLVRDELAGNEALKMERVRQLVKPSPTRAEWTLRGSSCTIGRWV